MKHLSLLAVGLLTSLLCLAGSSLAFPADANTYFRSMSFVYPLIGPRKSSKYGNRSHPKLKRSIHHDGIDLAVPYGTPIRAIADGRVIFADKYAGYGNLIVIEHEHGFTSHYGHCESIDVNILDRVKAGTIIGKVGSTGLSTGPHLHLEIRWNGHPENPENYLPSLGLNAEG